MNILEEWKDKEIQLATERRLSIIQDGETGILKG